MQLRRRIASACDSERVGCHDQPGVRQSASPKRGIHQLTTAAVWPGKCCCCHAGKESLAGHNAADVLLGCDQSGQSQLGRGEKFSGPGGSSLNTTTPPSNSRHCADKARKPSIGSNRYWAPSFGFVAKALRITSISKRCAVRRWC